MMDYESVLEYIHGSSRVGARTGFTRIRRVLELLGNPENKVKFVHIAGSNGKGSTASMTESVLRAAGYRTGLFVSPFITDYRERIQAMGRLITKDELCTLAEKVFPAIEQAKTEGHICTEFEVNTILGLTYFADMACDIAVLEVGMGGRLDQTNVIPAPLVCAIGSISFDHTEYLGNTIAAIAGEKCGIIKSGSRCALYCDLHPDALETAKKKCAEEGVEWDMSDMGKLRILEQGASGSRFTYGGEEYFVSLAGEHQVKNALTVLAIVRNLRAQGYDIPEEAVKKGLSSVSFTARLETVRRSPLCVVDSAHNPEKIRALCAGIEKLWPEKRLIAVMGMLADKEHDVSIGEIAKRADLFIALTPPSPRALPAEKAAEEAGKFCDRVITAGNVAEACRIALENADENSLILACGSMYFLGDARVELAK